MKKIIYSVAIVCLLAATISCKSTKAGKKGSGKKGEAPAETEVTAESEASAEAVAEAGEEKQPEESEEAKRAATKEKGLAEVDTKDFTGWIKASKKNVSEKYGKIQIKIKAGIGSYTLNALNETEKPVPVLSKANEYVTNAFYLKTSKKVYNLVTDSIVRSAARKTTDGAMIMYEIPSVAQLAVNFSCFSSVKDKETDMIKVTATIKNIGERNDEFSFKSMLDTVLGEAAPYHFYTYENVPIKNESLYRTLQNQKWFVSKNVNAEMQLFFTGADCTTPDLVALANYTTLDKNTWEPDMLSYRVFDTVLSYNNSAICVIWKPIKLAPGETGKIVFYMALSGTGAPATGEKYIYSKEFEEAPVETKLELKTPEREVEVITPYDDASSANPSNGPVSVKEISDSQNYIPAEPEKTEVIPTVDFYIKNMTKDHLTQEYIQSLLDRIAALEEDSPTINSKEILQLNAELDAILTYLRQ